MALPDPKTVTLEYWLEISGTRTGHMTFNGVEYDNLAEVEWRQANGIWRRPQPQ